MNNAEKIRHMTDEELAEFIVGLNDHCLAGIGKCDCSDEASIPCSKICMRKTRDWLQSEAEKENKVQLSELEPGETFKIGNNDFIVLEHTDDGTKVVSKGFMKENVAFDNDTRDYNKSHLKSVIEKEIQPLIEMEVGSENIVEHIVDLSSVDMQNEFGECRCKIRPITFDEARRYNNFLNNKDLDDLWWTCTAWSTEKRGYAYSIVVVSSSGYIGNYSCSDYGGVRPVCILKSNIFVSKGE